MAHSTNLYQFGQLTCLLPNKHLQQWHQHQLELQNNEDQDIQKILHLTSKKSLNPFLLNGYGLRRLRVSWASPPYFCLYSDLSGQYGPHQSELHLPPQLLLGLVACEEFLFQNLYQKYNLSLPHLT